MQLQWTTPPAANTLHLAAWLAEARDTVDRPRAAMLAEPLAAGLSALAEAGLHPPARWLDRAAALAATGVDNPHDLARQLLARHIGPPATSVMQAQLSAVVGNLLATETRLSATRGKSVAEELALRKGPLLDQWQTRGPGLLIALAQLTDTALLVDSARIALVLPAAGGHGVAHPPSNSVRLEAVLTNPHADVPEVVRLAWLLAQLTADLPRYGEHLPAGESERLMALALVPAVLAAAEEVELASAHAVSVGRALECWYLSAPASTLWQWWQTYREHPVDWYVALAALGQMLQ